MFAIYIICACNNISVFSGDNHLEWKRAKDFFKKKPTSLIIFYISIF